MLAAGALVASLLAVGASPAGALDEDSKVDAAAATSACVGEANDDMMFSDVSEGHYFRGAINCLAYYGVTVGYDDGTFRPNVDISREEMVLFMQRAAGVAGADAEAVVGDFAETGSDPVHRGDMALLIARLLVASTTAESPVNVTTDDDGTFKVAGVSDMDFFADSRRSQNRVHDSAASALYELGVAKGTGMGYFSPQSTVNRGAMAAFITRALAHTTARPEGVTIQSASAGEVTISVRDANFHPVANAAIDVFSASTARVDEAFNEDGTCNKPRLRAEDGGTSANMCVINPIDAVTGLSGDHGPVTIAGIGDGARTVFAWTGESGDKVEDGAEALAHIDLTETAPVVAAGTKITTDLGDDVDRAAFGSTVTVTIQLVGDPASGRADAGGAAVTYNVETHSEPMTDQASDDPSADLAEVTAGKTVSNVTVKTDASGKATFTLTATDPDPNNADDASGASVDWVTVSFTVTTSATGVDIVPDISATGADGKETIRFSDAPSVPRRATVTPAVKYLAAPASGSAGNAVTVKVVDQYGKPVRGHRVVLTSDQTGSTFPGARRTDSSGTVRIGYSRTGAAGVIEALTANTAAVLNTDGSVATAQAPIPGGPAMFYWVGTPAAPTPPATGSTVTAADLRVADVENNTVIIGDDGAVPMLLVYDDNDQFAIGTDNVTMAAFEEALAKKDTGDKNDVGAMQYNSADASVIARFTLTVNS